jgi:hypothetical protein
LERFGAPGSPPIPSPTKRSPHGCAAVILVECSVENIRPIGATRLKNCRGTVDWAECGHDRDTGF